MYKEFFGLKEKPFDLTPDPHFFFHSSIHKGALAYLMYGLENRKGFITISGEIGSGKTTLLRTLINNLDEHKKVAHIVNTKLTFIQLLRVILDDFEVEYSGSSKTDLLNCLNNFLLKEFAEGKNVILIIDEAQNFSTSSLEEIRLLSNLETEKEKLIQIILAGQPDLRDTLNSPKLKQLRQRIMISYHITALSRQECDEYIHHRLKIAGYNGTPVFDDDVLAEIHNYSGGVPRLINIICDALLLAAFAESLRTVNKALFSEVIEEFNIPSEKNTKETKFTSGLKGLHKKISDMSRKINELHSKFSWEASYKNELRALLDDLRLKQKNIIEKMDGLSRTDEAIQKKEMDLERREKELEKRLKEFEGLNN